MKPRTIFAVVVGVGGVVLGTTLLASRLIGSVTFLALTGIFCAVSLAIYLAERLREFSLRDLSFKLREIKQVKAEAEALYSKIDHLQQATMKLEKEEMEKLGLSGGHLLTAGGAMRYFTGCVKRERERLAQIFAESRSPEKIAQAILDSSMDEKVFKWNGPEIPLDADPISVEERVKKKQLAEAAVVAAPTTGVRS